MNTWMIAAVFFPLLVALGIGAAVMPLVKRLAFRVGRVAKPRPDRWHQKPTAMLGGIGIFSGFLGAILASSLVFGGWGAIPWGMLVGSGLVFLLGLYDDFRRISPPAKLAGQILAAAVVVFQGYTTTFFTSRIPNPVIAQIPNVLFTFVWLVAITNAINLLDNMDGLAGGISVITASILSFLFWSNGNIGLMTVSLALAGAALGFLIFNFPPATIFMGDSGSLFLGFTLAGLAIVHQAQASNVLAVLGVPTLLFLLPILDTTLVTITRLMRGQSPAQGGRDHTSHRLIAFGFTERKAVITLYLVALIAGVLAIALESIAYWYSLVIAPVVVIGLTLLTAYLGGLKVVDSTPSAGPSRPLTRIMLELTLRRRLLEVILDFMIIGIASYLAFFTRFGFTRGAGSLRFTLQTLPVMVAASYLAFFLFGIYRAVWRYVGVSDFVRYFLAATCSASLGGLMVYILYPSVNNSPVTYLLYALYLFLGLSASRASFRLLDDLSRRQPRKVEHKVVLVGAGDAGEMTLRWLLMNPQLNYRPMAFFDPSPFLKGRYIHGVEVVGELDQLEDWLGRNEVEGVIFTRQELREGVAGQQLIQACQSSGCWVRSLRLELELIE